MSYKSYNNYLGSNRCCNTTSITKGAQGAQGVAGPIGPANSGGTGSGITGAQGATGVQGATGGSPWTTGNAIGPQGAGYTGTGYTGDVLIFGNLLVTGGIDPTYLALTPQTSVPTSFINPLWIDSVNGNALRSQNIYMDNPSINNAYISLEPNNTNQIILNDGGTPNALSNTINYSSMTISDTLDTLTIDKSNITHSNATTPLTITSTGVNKNINIDTVGVVNIGDFSGATIANIALNTAGASRCDIDTRNDGVFSAGDIGALGGNTKILLNDNLSTILVSAPNGFIDVDSGGGSTTLGDVQGTTNGTTLTVSDGSQEITLTAGNGVKLTSSTIKYPCDFNNGNVPLAVYNSYAQTFNGGVGTTATLPQVNSANVGLQFLITNTSASALSVATSGGQLIYSSTGSASSATRSLATGHSQIFTAIKTLNGLTYGWSMV